MATVYLARDIKHDREVAIKVLDPDIAASIGGERFEREIRLAAKLQHPHILGLYDSGSADGLLFYVMPFVKGESLRDRLDRYPGAHIYVKEFQNGPPISAPISIRVIGNDLEIGAFGREAEPLRTPVVRRSKRAHLPHSHRE